MDEKAITLKEAAEILGLSYRTVYNKRHELAFRLPGGKHWRIWPSTINELQQNTTPAKSGVKMVALSSRGLGEDACQSTSTAMEIGTSISSLQAAKDLDARLGQKTK